MSHPWMKFYPSDWRSDPLLRSVSLAARGLWIEMLALMHDASPRGYLLVNGKKVELPLLTILTGVKKQNEVSSLLKELENAGVFSRDEEGIIYSRRMRRDEKKAFEDKANGSRGGNPRLKGGVNPPDKPTDNGGDKAHWHMASGSGFSPSLPSQEIELSVRDDVGPASNVRTLGIVGGRL